MIELTMREKQFYLDILENFISKFDKDKLVSEENIVYSRYFDENFKIYHGVTKIVLVPKNKGARYVVKIPMINKDGNDWCLAEEIVYGEAINRGLEEFFAETSFFYGDSRCRAYLQERVLANNSRSSEDIENEEWYEAEEDWESLSEESRENIENLEISGRLIDDLLRAYSDGEINNLIDFCAENYINDIHSFNYGYCRKSANPVIFDYSGIGSRAIRARGI